MLHFGFDDASTLFSVPDKTGRGNNGRGSGLKWTAAGKQAGAVDFAATNSSIVIAGSATLNMTQQTFAVWFRTLNSGTNERCIFDKLAANGYAIGISAPGADGKTGGKLRFTVSGHDCMSDAQVTDGAWHHGAAVYDGENLKVYVDGQLQKQVTPFHGAIPANTNDLVIGMNRSSPTPQEKGKSFEGTMDELMIFNHAISGEEVLAVMAAAKPKFTKGEVTRRLAELKELLDRGLILQDFYDRKVKECDASL
jgi:hypothetical protein